MDTPKTESGWAFVGMTVEETAEALRVDRKTVFNMIKDKGLPARRVGRGWRVDPEALRKWISVQAEPADVVADEEGQE